MSVAWFIVILVGILAYVLLDGYDLGAGVITLVTRDRDERNEIVEGIGSIWDGNETWLVFVGVALFGGLPAAFGLILPHLYLPLILMLFGLILRGVSVEMISQPHKGGAEGWYKAFGIGSLLAAFMQGLALGTLSVNVAHDGVRYLGGSFAFVGWFPLLMAVTVTFGYVALGYAWMHLHRIGAQTSVTSRGRIVSLVAVVGAVVALVTVGATDSGYRFSSPAIGWAFGGLLLFAAVAAVVTLVTFGSSTAKAEPFGGLSVVVAGVFLAFVVSHLPYVAAGLTLQEAAASSSTYLFLLVGVGLNMPLVLFYNWFSHHAMSADHVDAAKRGMRQGAAAVAAAGVNRSVEGVGSDVVNA